MFKLGHYTDGDWVEHSHPPIYAINAIDGPSSSILTTAPGSDPTVFERLATCMAPPYYLLYVLHTPRGEEEAGRYQSPAISEAEFASFIQKFEQFLKNDGRFDIWLHSQID